MPRSVGRGAVRCGAVYRFAARLLLLAAVSIGCLHNILLSIIDHISEEHEMHFMCFTGQICAW